MKYSFHMNSDFLVFRLLYGRYLEGQLHVFGYKVVDIVFNCNGCFKKRTIQSINFLQQF